VYNQPFRSDSCDDDPKNQPAEEEFFVDASTAAEFLHCSRKHILKLSIHGLIPAYSLPGSAQRRTWRYLLSELRIWMLRDGTCERGRPNHHNGRTIGSGSPRKGGR